MTTTTDPDLAPHPASAALAAAGTAVEELGSANLWSLSDAELLDLRVEQEQLARRLGWVSLATTREIDRPRRRGG